MNCQRRDPSPIGAMILQDDALPPNFSLRYLAELSVLDVATALFKELVKTLDRDQAENATPVWSFARTIPIIGGGCGENGLGDGSEHRFPERTERGDGYRVGRNCAIG